MSDNKVSKSHNKKQVVMDPMTAKIAPAEEAVLPPAKKSLAATKPTASQVIWNAMKDVKIPIFGLANQLVADYCQPVEIDPNKCYLLVKASSIIPLLEEVFADKYSFEVAHKYVIVSNKV